MCFERLRRKIEIAPRLTRERDAPRTVQQRAMEHVGKVPSWEERLHVEPMTDAEIEAAMDESLPDGWSCVQCTDEKYVCTLAAPACCNIVISSFESPVCQGGLLLERGDRSSDVATSSGGGALTGSKCESLLPRDPRGSRERRMAAWSRDG